MAFIGTPLDTRNTFQSLVGKRFNGDGSTTAFTLDVAPSSTLDIEVFVGNVRQDPNSAYTLSGTTLTFTGAPPSGTNNIYVVHQAKSVGTIDLPEGALVDLNGGSDKLVLDADGDTSITADTDDQIDVKAAVAKMNKELSSIKDVKTIAKGREELIVLEYGQPIEEQKDYRIKRTNAKLYAVDDAFLELTDLPKHHKGGKPILHNSQGPMGIMGIALINKLEASINSEFTIFLPKKNLTVRTEKDGKYGRMLGWLYCDNIEGSINHLMIESGHAWPYDGGTKDDSKDRFEILEDKRIEYSMSRGLISDSVRSE